MPILFNHQTDEIQVQIAHCTETDEQWLTRLPAHLLAADDFNSIQHAARKREWLTSRTLVYEMDGSAPDFDLQKDAFGKPFLAHRNEDDTHISLSHSGDYCAIIRAGVACGIDVQYFTPKMARISDRFMRPEEWAAVEDLGNQDDEQIDQTLHFYWSAKEAIYKAWGTKNLSAQRIHILSETHGVVRNLQDNIIKNYILASQKTADFECVWAVFSEQ
jgi:phosphopantetheinyl transferase